MYTKDGFHKALEQKLGDDAYLLLANGGHKKLADLLTAASLTADGNNTKLSITVGGTTKIGSLTVPYASNADKVDGIHANGLLTAASLGTSGNSTTISVTVGGTTKSGSVTVPYATNSDTVDDIHASEFYNENYGSKWTRLRISNTETSWANKWIKVAVFNCQNPGTYAASKIHGYFYKHNGNWEFAQTYKIPFQIIVNFTGDTADFYYSILGSTTNLRLIKLGTRNYEFQVKEGSHTEFDIFYQIVNPGNVTGYTEITAGTTTYVSEITPKQIESYGNYAYKSDTLDGYHADGLLTAASLGASGNSTTLSVTVGGTTKTSSVTVPYASAAAKWTTARTLTIGSTGKSVNGSGNVSWSLAEIGAAAAGHNHDGTYLKLSGGTMTGVISKAGTSVSWYQGRNTTIIKTTSYTGYNALVSMKTTNGSWDFGVYSNDTAYLTYITDANYNANTNTTTYQLTFPKKTGTIAITSDIPTNNNQLTNGAGYITSSGSCTYATSAGSATTATILLTNNTAQAADACYNESPGLRFWRYNGTSSTTGQGGGDGWIMSWSWNAGSVGGQIYVDDNPSKIMCIRGRNNDANKTFTTWATILHSDNYTSYTVTKTGSGASGTWGINITGSASSASSASYLSTYAADGDNNLKCLQNVFNSLPKSVATAVRLQHGSHSMAIGWFLNGYGYSNAYGGWFISDYGNPVWVGVDNGSWNTCTFITTNNIGSQSVNYATSAGSATTASQVKDAGNGTAITFKYSTGGFTSNPSWLGAWNGYQLTYVSPSVLSVNYASSAGNSDTVDSYHANRFAFTYCSANYGASSSVTVNDLVTNGVSNASHGMIYAATDNPVGSANWVHVWSQQWTIGTTSSWVSQIALGVQQGNGMWYRTYSGNIVGRGWTRVLDSSNYTSYAISRSGDDVTGHYTFRGRVFGYNYNNQGNNAAAFMWDKPGSYYTGMGPNGVTNQIHFGPCNADGTWVSGFSQQWEFQGNVYATNFYTTSDRTKKTNIESIASIVPIRKFNWKQDGSLSYGFIAQELVELGHEELVHGKEGNMTVNYDAALSFSMAKLSNYVEKLENTVKELQQEIKILKGEA